MINEALTFLKNQVNDYLKVKTGEENKLTTSNIVAQNGESLITDLGLTLVRIEEEKIHKSQKFYQETGNRTTKYVNPEIRLNLYLLFTANFGKNYQEALKFLSHVVTFFQGKNLFDHQNSPTLHEKIEKLIAELYSMSFEQQNHLWGTLGAKYIPSVMYKVKMLAIQQGRALDEAMPIQIIDQNHSTL